MKRTLLLLAMALALLLPAGLLLPGRASAHFTNCDSVENSTREIRWTSTTVLTAQRDYAIAQWNALGRINIAPDTPSTVANLRFEDVARPDKTWVGLYVCRWSRIDLIQFNLSNLFGASNAARQSTAIHELGHALRLDHSFLGQVMNPFLQSPPLTTLQSHDRADYCALWGFVAGCPDRSGGSGGDGYRPVPPDRVQP